jgi:two-component system sensor histidine kinase DegS
MQAKTVRNDLTHRAVAALREVETEIASLAREADERYHDLLARWQERGGAGPDGANVVRDLEQRLTASRRTARQLNLLVRLHRDLVDDLEGKTASPAHADLKADLPRIRLIQSQEEGYLRIARKLREGVGQIMANAVLELEYFDHLSETDLSAARKGLQMLKEEMRAGFKDLQRIVEDLGPPPLLGELGLAPSLRRYIENFERESALQTAMDIEALPTDLPPTMEVAIFRVVQEALQNVWKHAQASGVGIKAHIQGNELVVSVADDGQGFRVNPHDPEERGQHLGLILMRDRADLMGGRLQVRNREQGGTEVILSVPYPVVSTDQATSVAEGESS